MKSLWNDENRANLLARIERVAPDARPLWGKMNAGAMLAHITESLRMACGEIECQPRKLPIRFFPLKQLIIYLLPFPKGAPTAKELLQGSDRPAEESKTQLRRLFLAFASRKGSGRWPDHPAFGRLTEREWGVLCYRHFDHHLRQFQA